MSDTIYKETRKKHDLTRDDVCDKASLMNIPIQPERLERIENGKFPITPDEVMLLAEIYGEPTLCNHYCSKECPIGEKYVPEVKVKDLAQIVLEMLSSLNSMKKSQERLIEITASDKTDVACNIKVIDERKMKVMFMSGDTEIYSFDMKQMISHLLGVATAFLKGDFEIKKIDFVYLLFNPKLIEINEERMEIHRIYEQTCNECNSVDFKALFEVIVDYLQTVKGLGKDKNKTEIVNNFSFRLCDQSNIKGCFD